MGRGKSPRARLAVLASRIRFEEKAIFAALRRRGAVFERLEERMLSFVLADPLPDHPAVLNRCISSTRALYAARLLEAAGVRVVNESRVVEVCGDKLLTTLALRRSNLPVPRTMAALTPEAARQAVEVLGLPVVVKPLVGSWGRLLARVRDIDALEALLEHRKVLGSPQHRVVYFQEYVDKPGYDIRTIVLGDRVVASMYRCSDHWITNTARAGTTTRPCPLNPELEQLSLQAAEAVGGGALAVDLLERSDGALLVNEVNHIMEFHGITEVCDRDIADCLVAYTLEVTETGGDRDLRAAGTEGTRK